jgi:hypothetical protein
MKVRNVRIASVVIAAVTVLTIGALTVPAAMGATKYELRFLAQPRDAQAGANITSAHFVDGSSFVKVQLVESASGIVVTNSKALVTFQLKTGDGFASGDLRVTPQPLINGVAEFGGTSLRILTENEPQFTSYALVPITLKNPIITGPASSPFDIWEAGDSCAGGDDSCEVFLRGIEDHYTLDAAGTLGASELPGALPGLVCDGQDEIFPNTVFSYATTGSNTPVFLENHISKEVWQASANNGQAHADWCVGLLSNAPWEKNGASSTLMDTNGPLVAGGFLYVALAPRCPVANPASFAPCIVSQTADGMGGSTTFGWLPAGDPPRRT